MNVAHTNHTLAGLKALHAHVSANPVSNGDDLMPLAVSLTEAGSPADMAVRYLNRAAPSIRNGRGTLLPRTPGADALLVIEGAMALASA